MNKAIVNGFVILFSIYISNCSKPTEPSPSEEIENIYVPMNVGDVRQIIRQYDSSTTLYKMLYNTKRQDGVNAFAVELTVGTHSPDTGYYCIRNGFYMITNLRSGSNTSNPFEEVILAKINPTDGDRFVSATDYPDTFFLAAKYYQLKSTICGNFNDVFGFILTFQHAGVPDTADISFYAKHIGYIATYSKYIDVNYDVSYLKIGNQEYGALWPPKNLSPILSNTKQSARQLIPKIFLSKNKRQLTSGSS
jgi:hypothetical protein